MTGSTTTNHRLARRLRVALAVLCCVASAAAQAQIDPADYGFDAGSDGSLGALDACPTEPLVMPEDGIFNYTTVTLPADCVVSFVKNELNTPVFMLAQGDIVLEANSVIDIAGGPAVQDNVDVGAGGMGGPGGFRGGHSPAPTGVPGYGRGPGGGDQFGRFDYGSELLLPLVGGSGGAGRNNTGLSYSGGGGGGAILLASNTRIVVDGTIDARGGSLDGAWRGSGGAVRLVAPVVEGDGAIDVSSNSTGRVRVDAIDITNFNTTRPGSRTAFGTYLVPFLTDAPDLRIAQICVSAACDSAAEDRDIDANVANDVLFVAGSSPNRAIRVVADNFPEGTLGLRLVLVPERGEPQTFDAELDLATSTEATFDVTFVQNMPTTVMVWTP